MTLSPGDPIVASLEGVCGLLNELSHFYSRIFESTLFQHGASGCWQQLKVPWPVFALTAMGSLASARLKSKISQNAGF